MSDTLPGRGSFLDFWGKARPSTDQGARWHPVAYHLLDVAAVADRLLLARPSMAARLARLLGLPVEESSALVVALAALHDLGKFAPAFQSKAPAHWPAGALGAFRDEYAVPRAHTEDGVVLWEQRLSTRLSARVWDGGAEPLRLLAPAVFGHHGRPVGVGYGRDPVALRFSRQGLAAAEQCADAVIALLLPSAIVAPPPDESRIRVASWLLSGLITVADWVGSNERWFGYVAPDAADATLHGYWARARQQAAIAIREAGLVPSMPSPERPFAEVAGRTDPPTPVQAWASRVALPANPTLFVIEDVTGAGKTEAAQMLVHRLMAAGRATGAYWAMPTMATANAMFARQGRAIGALYVSQDDGTKPSLVLAHGQQRLHEGFRSTVLRGQDDASTLEARSGDGVDDELESSVACAAFLADDRRAALLADVGAGTVDQALLGVLPSRFNTVRLAGLADKVLVVDEAHAYDAYVGVELQELLRFQAALGGSAVVLSATLSRKQRVALAQAWIDGLAGGGRVATSGGGVALASPDYPLATVVADATVVETPLGAAPWSHRTVAVGLVHDVEHALAHVVAASARGGAVAWVRNTVDDCLAAAALLRARGIEPLVFHARFAQGDRQAREAEVMALFGQDASAEQRRGRVLVATQVVEQSLDLDFDAMVSDVAPIDLLVQRAGRLWRHETRTRARRPEGLPMELVVLSPEPADEPPGDWLSRAFRGTAHVYANAGVLWRTVQALHDAHHIETPGGLRALIARVYDSDDVPESLLATAQRAEGKQGAHAATANYAVLKAPDGYHADAVAWVSDMRVPTRLGDPRTTVRLARARADGTLEPWVLAEGPAWKSWALSEASVSAYRVPAGSRPAARYADAVARLRAGWGRFEQEVPVVVLEPAGSDAWVGRLEHPDGKARRIGYAMPVGLSFPAADSPAD